MGQEIVHQESINDPGRRSRLWKPEEVHEVLKFNRSIKQCGVFLVCASAWGLNLFGSSSKEVFELESLAQISDTDTESRPKAIGVGGSDNENENEWEHLHTSSQ
ncbi:hypothetical protein JHK82_043542 [Glycine max]|nr:hypothetical protein JHK82_043542 [Glycine max]